ncbi:alpha-1,6-glucosidase [Luteimicrobium album]|uniref:Alpha-1,6-glucosidase n=1 Tax=Luteimicrobium album TaxID=1054550 RepID=A0ABQ6I2X9_9MICO|nr:pullulanase-type alpha-1,6-glucosidase [Luteimicrobium album]GMA24299.1 alpha-1,6-glucosidase [Luteimicrobium album]
MLSASAADAQHVSIPGTQNTEMGCASDWDVSCSQAELTKRPDGVWSGTYDLPAGSYEYKAALNDSWDVNYGAGGAQGGDNITYTTDGSKPVTFFYDPVTHWATNTAADPIVSAVGDFQTQLGCASDDDAGCLGAWLEDPDGNGIYTAKLTGLTAGTYHVRVAHGLSDDEVYGQSGAKGGDPIPFTVDSGKQVVLTYTLATHALAIDVTDAPVAGEAEDAAPWVDARTVAVPADLAADATTWALYSSSDASLTRDGSAVSGGTKIPLTADPKGLTAAQLKRFPALKGYVALHPRHLSRAAVEQALQGELRLAAWDGEGTLRALTGVQVPGVLDDVDGTSAQRRSLGVTWAHDAPQLALWAPTAQDVDLLLYPASGTGKAQRVQAHRASDGTWTVAGAPSWRNRQYLYEVKVYAPTTGRIETNDVTDPYSVALTTNSTRSVLVDLADRSLEPSQWARTASPRAGDPTQQTIYELSVRDFSATDPTVPAALRGTYGAFATNSDGSKHLKTLAKAGLTTVHLQPTFDFATVNEDRSQQKTPDCDLASYAPDSDQQQACVGAVTDFDAYNWGYDPLHYLAPEGSYAVHPDGGSRVAEFRTMVGALHADGLRVVVDEVFNHTSASGQDKNSVLDKVVPGYYQRLDATGAVETSTCCQDVATEHTMAQKLMVDSVVLWAKEYKVDGFRFDLMGFHSVDNMKAVRAALDKLTLRKDGVDGKTIYLYGEGWNFGAVANNAYFTQATQGQLDGTGIGTFNDRLRDGVRGGSPVDSSTVQQQGYGSGLFTDPNGNPSYGTADDASKALLGHDEDLVKLGLSGNLKDFTFVTSDGTTKKGSEVDYNGQPAGYASEPDESISYVDAHDNQTLFDALTLKLPQVTSMADRVRMQTLSLATATLSQSPSLWLAGSDLLRSKSLDNNSYNSGDWFNAIDWSGKTNGFGKGLPLSGDNGSQWSIMKPLLADKALNPTAKDIATATDQAQQLLRLKRSTPLFSLGSAKIVEQKLTFPATATPGVIAMNVDDTRGKDVDRNLDGVLVVFNAGTTTATETLSALKGKGYVLSTLQRQGDDPVVKRTTWDARTGTVSVPARTVAVLTLAEPRGGHGGHGNRGGHGHR